MRVLVVEDEIKMASLIRRGLRSGGPRRRRGHQGRGRPLDGRLDRLRRDRARRDAPGHRRLRDVPPPARGGHLVAGDHAHRARRRRGPRGRPGRRRRRLPGQAVLVRRAAGAPARARPPRPGRAPGGARGRRPASWTRPRRRVWRGETEVGALGQGVPAAGDVHASPGRGALALPAARARVGLRLREPLEHRRRLRPLPARQDRPAVRRLDSSRPCAAPATGSTTACRRTSAPPSSPVGGRVSSATGRAASSRAARSGGPCAAAPTPTGRPGRR